MKKTDFPEELTPEELATLDSNAIELAKKYGVSKVHIYVALGENNERIVGYIKEPSYLQKIYAMDKIASVGAFTAAEEMRAILTLEESNELTKSTDSECDQYRLGMASTCLPIIQVAVNNFKKK